MKKSIFTFLLLALLCIVKVFANSYTTTCLDPQDMNGGGNYQYIPNYFTGKELIWKASTKFK